MTGRPLVVWVLLDLGQPTRPTTRSSPPSHGARSSALPDRAQVRVVRGAATQKPSHDVVPTWIRDLFSYRIALRCTSKEASDTILGQGWAARGFSASSINPDHRGVAYLLAEGGVPHRIRVTHLTDVPTENPEAPQFTVP